MHGDTERFSSWTLREVNWGADGCYLPPPFFLDLNIQAADLLIQGRERHMEALGGLGLIPITAFQHVGDDSTLNVLDDLKERRIRRWIVHIERRSPAHHGIGQ